MRRERFSSFLGALFSVVVAASACQAQTPCGCWQVSEGDDINCTGTNGCTDSYPLQFCEAGCSYGHCGAQGYALCCDDQWRPKAVYGANQCGGSQDCGECGAIPLKARHHAPLHKERLVRDRLEIATKQEGVGLDPGYLAEDTMLFVPNRCRRTYGILYPRDLDRPQTNSASQPQTTVPAGGGL
jgi:hypothetical protein